MINSIYEIYATLPLQIRCYEPTSIKYLKNQFFFQTVFWSLFHVKTEKKLSNIKKSHILELHLRFMLLKHDDVSKFSNMIKFHFFKSDQNSFLVMTKFHFFQNMIKYLSFFFCMIRSYVSWTWLNQINHILISHLPKYIHHWELIMTNHNK